MAGEPLRLLEGIPFTVKDIVNTKDVRTTFGAVPYRDNVPDHDAVAVAQVLDSGLVGTLERNVEIETESELCRGRTVVDLWRRTTREPNAHVGVEINSEGFLELLIERLNSLE